MKYEKIVFVSKDGTFRAPIAAAIMKKNIKKSVKIQAKGHVVLFPEPVNPKALQMTINAGYNLKENVSDMLKEEDFGIRTLVLVMTEKMKQQIYDSYKKAVNVYSLKEFSAGDGDIESPFGKKEENYTDCFEQLEEWVKKAAELINSYEA